MSFFRKNLPRLLKEASRAALDWNKDLYRDAILAWIALWGDLNSLCQGPELTNAWFSRWCSLMRGPSIFELIQKLEDFDEELLHTSDRSDFYLKLSESRLGVPNWSSVRDFATRMVSSPIMCQHDCEFVPLLRSCLLFLKRIQGPEVDANFEDWLQVDKDLETIKIPRVLIDLPAPSLRSKGQLTTGSVADVPRSYGMPGRKALASCTMSRADWRSASKLGLLWPPSMMYPDRRIVGDPVAVLLSVPKNWKKPRYITKEPAAQAWAQQIVKDSLRDAVKNWTLGFCDPSDDSLNRSLICRRGFSTIDLTAASDTVHKDWINTIPNPRLRRAVWCTRTPYVLVDGTLIKQTKAAGMGCGWTFPLECWVFSQIVLACQPTKEWAVFGDDIVVEDEIFDDVINLLRRFGFVPNREKSFGQGTCFRESCGLHVFHWFSNQRNTVIDASPVLFPGRSTLTGIGQSPENFINLQREATGHAWMNLRYVISRFLQGKIPFSQDWESNLPFSLQEGVYPDPTWGKYSLPASRPKRYSVDDRSRYPFSLLQTYTDCWGAMEPYYRWTRDTLAEPPFRWHRR